LALAARALERNGRHHQARHLKISLLRHLGKHDAALAAADESLCKDSLEYGALWERHLLLGDAVFGQITGLNTDTLIELALDYAHAGLFEDGVTLLDSALEGGPMVKYTLGWIHEQAGETKKALKAFQEAAKLSPDTCFPNRLEDILSLSTAIRLNPSDARAPYYLGNFWYAHRRYREAIATWEQARALDDQFPTTHRNLGLAYYNKLGEPRRAVQSLETAFGLNRHDARVYFELDQLYKKLNYPPAERLALHEQYEELVEQRDDLTIERIMLLNLLQRPEEAYRLLMKRNFHPWEGGEGKVTRQYVLSLVEMARQCIAREEFKTAVQYLEKAQIYPQNLGEGKLYGAQENNIFYYLGCANEGLGEMDRAREWFARAAVGLSEPTSAMFYNDQPPDMIFYQGLARNKLGQMVEAEAMFRKLVVYGQGHMNDDVQIDYFAISLPNFLVFDEDLKRRNKIHCHYMIGLGNTGLGAYAAAQANFDEVLKMDVNHLGSVLQRQLLRREKPARPMS
jgi:tetratricopeptide (TPR) repeat protein